MSDALEVFERLETGAAAVQRLTRRRAELAHHFRVERSAARTSERSRPAQHLAHVRYAPIRGNNAVLQQLAPALRGDPVAAPRRRQHVGHFAVAYETLPQRFLD